MIIVVLVIGLRVIMGFILFVVFALVLVVVTDKLLGGYMRLLILIWVLGALGCTVDMPGVRNCPGVLAKWQSYPVKFEVGNSLSEAHWASLVGAARMIEVQAGARLFEFKRLKGDGARKLDGHNQIALWSVWPLGSNIQAQTALSWGA